MIGSKKELAVILSRLKPFATPKQTLEQYSTDSEIAATILWDAYMKGDIEGKEVTDLGCGTGILGIGALLLGAKKVVFVELDGAIIPLLKTNLETHEGENYTIENIDVGLYAGNVDTIIMNPPFGTQKKHADMAFLDKAAANSNSIYSLHKTATINHLISWSQKHSFKVETLDFSYPLKSTLSHHKKRIECIDVTCLILRKD